MDRSAARLAAFFLTTLFRASGLAIVTLPLLHRMVPSVPSDAWLLAALGVLAASTLALRTVARRGHLDVRGVGMAIALLIPALSLAACAQRTGALESPLLVMLGVLVAVGALLLGALGNFVFLSGVSLLLTLMAIVTQEQMMPLGGAPAATARATLLVLELGLLVLLGFSVNQLARQLRDQRDELTGLDLRDPETGTLRSAFFQARLVALLDGQRGRREGVFTAIFELPGATPPLLHEAGALLLESLRSRTDLAGRLAGRRFAIAGPASADDASRIARRIARTLAALGLPGMRSGCAHRCIGDDAEPVREAAALLAEADDALREAHVGFAAA